MSVDPIENQATINIGTIGHVAHGKSTLVRALSGIHTVRFKTELERNVTIKLGYANAKIYKCINCGIPNCAYYTSRGSSHPSTFDDNGHSMKLVRHVSFVDCPGHNLLMSTMLNGASVMDSAILLVAGNEPFPQPQTTEHLAAVGMMKLDDVVVIQNKMDLVPKKDAIQQFQTIRRCMHDSVGDTVILPISAQAQFNIDTVCRYIAERIPTPSRNLDVPPRMNIVRSFDVNKPGTLVSNLVGGIAGGSIVEGILRVGQEIEIRPGEISKDATGKVICRPLVAMVTSLCAEKNKLDYAVPGGLIGVGTSIDPAFTRADRLVGHILGVSGSLPPVFIDVELSTFMLPCVMGKPEMKTDPLMKSEHVMLNVGATSSSGVILDTKCIDKYDFAKVSLTIPVCAYTNDKVAINRKVDGNWRLVGWGFITAGTKLVN